MSNGKRKQHERANTFDMEFRVFQDGTHACSEVILYPDVVFGFVDTGVVYKNKDERMLLLRNFGLYLALGDCQQSIGIRRQGPRQGSSLDSKIALYIIDCIGRRTQEEKTKLRLMWNDLFPFGSTQIQEKRNEKRYPRRAKSVFVRSIFVTTTDIWEIVFGSLSVKSSISNVKHAWNKQTRIGPRSISNIMLACCFIFIDLFHYGYIDIRPSSIEKAGLGLFSRVDDMPKSLRFGLGICLKSKLESTHTVPVEDSTRRKRKKKQDGETKKTGVVGGASNFTPTYGLYSTVYTINSSEGKDGVRTGVNNATVEFADGNLGVIRITQISTTSDGTHCWTYTKCDDEFKKYRIYVASVENHRVKYGQELLWKYTVV
jgi:hypothetical protein